MSPNRRESFCRFAFRPDFFRRFAFRRDLGKSGAAARDVTLLGAGMAGLSVAAALRAKIPEIKLHLIDPRAGYSHDKSFSYFALHAHRFESAVSRRFSKIAVFDSTRSLTLNVEKTPYCLLPSDQFYAAAHSAIGAATHAPSADADAVDLCFDSSPMHVDAPLWQVFAGGEFSARQCGKPLALDTAVLMDFRIAQAGAVRFVYLLPLHADRVLVQDTWITPNAAIPDFAASQMALSTHLMRHFQLQLGACLRVENGAIPMRVARSEDIVGARGIPIGARGGWLRGATGYSFLEAQRGAEQLARWVSETSWTSLADQATRQTFNAHGLAPLRTRPRLSDWMDQLFLRAIQRHPERAADWFTTLFASAPTDALIRFLGGTASVTDHLRIATALPKTSFLPALFGRLTSR